MSTELELLKEYAKSLGLYKADITWDDIQNLRSDLEDNGEYGLADLIDNLSDPNELKDYIGDEENG